MLTAEETFMETLVAADWSDPVVKSTFEFLGIAKHPCFEVSLSLRARASVRI